MFFVLHAKATYFSLPNLSSAAACLMQSTASACSSVTQTHLLPQSISRVLRKGSGRGKVRDEKSLVAKSRDVREDAHYFYCSRDPPLVLTQQKSR